MDTAVAKQKKTNAKRGLTRIENLLNGDTTDWVIGDVRTRLTRIQNYWEHVGKPHMESP